MESIKEILKKNVGHMKENGKEDNIKLFRAQATEFVKFVVSKINNFTFYSGDMVSPDDTRQIAYCYSKDEDDYLTKTFMFFNVALIEETL